MEEDLNRIKVAFDEMQKTNKWLFEHLEIAPSTVSKWCTNTTQPDIETLLKISKLLGRTG